MKKTTVAAFALIIISLIIAIWVYPVMPERIASHWDATGQVNDWMPKFWGLFLMPILSACILLLFLAIPKIDPLKKNIKKFIKYYDWFIVLFVVFLFYIHILSILWNLEYRFNMTSMITPAIGLLIIYLGILTENAKMNWFIGIRTPWTLSSDKVWEKTHKLAGKLFKIAGFIAFLGMVFQKYAVWLLLAPILIAAIYPAFYSYFAYQKLKKK